MTDKSYEKAISEKIARIISALFRSDDLFGPWAMTYISIAAAVNAVDSYTHSETCIKSALNKLVRAKVLRSRVSRGVRRWEMRA